MTTNKHAQLIADLADLSRRVDALDGLTGRYAAAVQRIAELGNQNAILQTDADLLAQMRRERDEALAAADHDAQQCSWYPRMNAAIARAEQAERERDEARAERDYARVEAANCQATARSAEADGNHAQRELDAARANFNALSLISHEADAERARLRAALRRLRAEVTGLLGVWRKALVDIAGTTEVRCVERALHEADEALADRKATPPCD